MICILQFDSRIDELIIQQFLTSLKGLSQFSFLFSQTVSIIFFATIRNFYLDSSSRFLQIACFSFIIFTYFLFHFIIKIFTNYLISFLITLTQFFFRFIIKIFTNYLSFLITFTQFLFGIIIKIFTQ